MANKDALSQKEKNVPPVRQYGHSNVNVYSTFRKFLNISSTKRHEMTRVGTAASRK